MADYLESLRNALSPNPPSNYATPAQIARLREYSRELQSNKDRPQFRGPGGYSVYTWANGLNDALRQVMGGRMENLADQYERYQGQKGAENLTPVTSDAGETNPAPVASGTAAPVKWSGDAGDAAGFIKSQEGFNPSPYRDGNRMSIGYGTEAQSGDKAITEQEAHARMTAAMAPLEKMLAEKVQVPLTPSQRTALTSFGYNAGPGALEKVLPKVNAGDFPGAANHMGQYIYFQGQPHKGLMSRRNQEMDFLARPEKYSAPPAADKFAPPGDIRTLPPGAPPGAGVPPPPTASLPAGPAGSMVQPASFSPGAMPPPAAPGGFGGAPMGPGGVPPGPGADVPKSVPGVMPVGDVPPPPNNMGPTPPINPAGMAAPTQAQLPPGLPTIETIREMYRNPDTRQQAIELLAEERKIAAPQQVVQPTGETGLGNPYTQQYRQNPWMAKPDILKSPIKLPGGLEVEQQLVPQRQPGGQIGLRDINPITQGTASPSGPTAGGLPQGIPALADFGTQLAGKLAGTKKTAEETATTLEAPVRSAVQGGEKAVPAMQQLGVLREALKEPGISGGVLGHQFQDFKSAFKQLTGVDIGATAAGERIGKINTVLAFTDTGEVTKRPAFMEIVMQMKANPGLLNSVETSNYLVDMKMQEQKQRQELAGLATKNVNRREWAHERDEFYKDHPLISPLTGKPLNDPIDAYQELFALSLKSGAKSNDLMKLGQQLSMTPEQTNQAAANASKALAENKQAAAPAAQAPAFSRQEWETEMRRRGHPF